MEAFYEYSHQHPVAYGLLSNEFRELIAKLGL